MMGATSAINFAYSGGDIEKFGSLMISQYFTSPRKRLTNSRTRSGVQSLRSCNWTTTVRPNWRACGSVLAMVSTPWFVCSRISRSPQKASFTGSIQPPGESPSRKAGRPS